MYKRKKIWKPLALLLSLALLLNSVTALPVRAEEKTVTVYVDSQKGVDTNAGTSAAEAFQTLNAAITAVDGMEADHRIVKVVGEYQWTSTIEAPMAEHVNPITIEGNTGSGTDKLTVPAGQGIANINGPLTIDNIDIAFGSAGWHIAAYGHELVLGEGVSVVSNPPDLITGAYYHHDGINRENRHCVTVRGGNWGKVWLGESVLGSSWNLREVKGVDFTLDGGSVADIRIGSNGWKGNYGACSYAGDVNITINGGTITDKTRGVRLMDLSANGDWVEGTDKQMTFNGNAVQIIFNNGTSAGIPVPTAESIEKLNGVLYILNCEASEGSGLAATGTAGTYAVQGDKLAVAAAADGSVYYSENGFLTVPKGTYTVTWRADLPVVYVDNAGSDGNDGASSDRPVQSLARALELSGEDPVIRIVNEASYDSALDERADEVTIEGVQPGAVLSYGGADMELWSDLTLRSLTLYQDGDNTSIYTKGHDLAIAGDVTFTHGEFAGQGNPLFVTGGSEEEYEKFMLVGSGCAGLTIGDGGAVAEETRLILDGAAVETITVDAGDPEAAIKAVLEGGSVAAVQFAEGSTFASMELLASGGGDLTGMETSGNTWYITTEENVAFTDQAGTFHVDVPSGSYGVAVSEAGAYVAGEASVSGETPRADYGDNTYYSDCIEYRGSLANTYRKLTQDKSLKVMYFGGSLTNGYGCSDNDKTMSWRVQSSQWFEENFPEAEIETINAAIGESGTLLGTYRVQEDIIAQQPDLVFVEYAINDRYTASAQGLDDAQAKEMAASQYETIVREIKQALPDCDIVTLITMDRSVSNMYNNKTLYPTAAGHAEVAEAYGLPVVNVAYGFLKHVAEITGNSNWMWTDTFFDYVMSDNVHALDSGQNEYWLCLEEYLENSLLNTDYDGYPVTRQPLPEIQSSHLLDGDRRQPMGAEMQEYFVEGDGAEYKDDYFYTGTSNAPHNGYYELGMGDSATFRFTGTEIALWSNLYNDSSFRYSVDGQEPVTMNSSQHAPVQVVSGLSSGEHTIEIAPVTFGADVTSMKIGALFIRDAGQQSVQGETDAYGDINCGQLVLPAGNYQVLTAATVGELPQPVSGDGAVFAGWQDGDGTILEASEPLAEGMVLTPVWMESEAVVYVDSKDGSDSNTGASPEEAFQTLNKAIETLDGKAAAERVVKIIGDYSWSFTKADPLAAHTNPIVIEGNTGSDTDSLTVSGSLANINGPLTIDKIKLKNQGGSYLAAYGHELVIGEAVVTEGNTLELITGAYYDHDGINRENRHSVTVRGGTWGKAWLGESVLGSSWTLREVKGVDFTLEGGSVMDIRIGGDGWSGNYGACSFTGDVNITVNGGTISDKTRGIRLTDWSDNNTAWNAGTDKQMTFNGNAVQIIFNNGTGDGIPVPAAASIEKLGGVLYILNCEAGEGSSLIVTETAGTYEVQGDKLAVAKTAEGDTYYSENGLLTVPEGSYTVTWAKEYEEVYVDGVNGSDDNTGASPDDAFQTLNHAIQVLDAMEAGNRTVKIVGEYEWTSTTSEPMAEHANTITIEGNDDDAKLTVPAGKAIANINGPLTIDNIDIAFGEAGWYIAAYGHDLVLGEGVQVSNPPDLITGAYYDHFGINEEKRHSVTVLGGSWGKAWLGESVLASGWTLREAKGVDFTLNGGSVEDIRIGGNGWDGNFGATSFTGDVNITVNGGTITNKNNGVRLFDLSTQPGWNENDDKRMTFNNNAVQILFNNGTGTDAETGTDIPVPAAASVEELDGVLYVLKCEALEGSSLTITDTAGTYRVNGERAASATDGVHTYVSEDGILKVPAGTYTVTWERLPGDCVVYVDSLHGNDGNQGTAEAPFKTLEAAVAAIEASEYEQGVVNIIGTLEISGDLPEHGKMLTLQGSTAQDGILISKAFTVNGPVTFQEMKVTLTDAYLSIYGEGDEVNFGQGITNSLYPYLRLYLGTYNSDNPQAERGTVDSGRLYTVNIGAYNSMGTDKSTAGVSYVQNGGEVSYLYLGGDGYEAAGVKFLKTIFTEDVNLTLNGGQVGEIRLLTPQEGAQGSLTERDVVFEKAVQILINNDAAVSNALPEITAAGGVWVMDSAGTGHALSVTDTAGVYTVPDGLTAVAYAQDGSDIYVSEDGILTVTEPGTYRVEYETDLTYTNSGTEITFYQATTVDFEELTHREMEGKLFVGWVDEEGNAPVSSAFRKGDKLTARYVDYTFTVGQAEVTAKTDAAGASLAYELELTLPDGLDAAKDVQYGMLEIENRLRTIYDLTLDGEYTCQGQDYEAVKTVAGKVGTETSLNYTYEKDDLTGSDYETRYVLRGYISYTDGNGVSRVVYTPERIDSVSLAAEAALEAGAQGAEAEACEALLQKGKEALQETYDENKRAALTESSMGGAIGAGLTLSADRLTATVTGSDGKTAESFYKLEEGLLVRDVVIEPVSTMEEPVTVVQVSDPHFNYCNEEDLAENNPSTMSTWNNRDLNSFKRMPERAHKALQNLIDGMEYASAYGDATVVTGDVLDYLSWGNLELMKRFITTSYPDTLVTLGNHEPVRVMGLPTDVADPTTLQSRLDILQENWNHDIYYTSQVVNGQVLVIQMDNGQNRFWESQVAQLEADLDRARKEGYTVLLFLHVPISTNDPADTAVEPLLEHDPGTYDFNSGVYVIGSDESTGVYDLITNNADVIKGIFAGHMHSDFYTEVQARTADGKTAVIPQYILTGSFYGDGNVLKITVGGEAPEPEPEVIRFLGGSLLMDEEETAETELRFGYNIVLPEGAKEETLKWSWKWGLSETELSMTTEGVNKLSAAEAGIEGVTEGVVSNIVITEIPRAEFATSIYTQLTISYETEEGTTVTLTEPVVRERSVQEVAKAILAEGTDEEKAYVQNLGFTKASNYAARERSVYEDKKETHTDSGSGLPLDSHYYSDFLAAWLPADGYGEGSHRTAGRTA